MATCLGTVEVIYLDLQHQACSWPSVAGSSDQCQLLPTMGSTNGNWVSIARAKRQSLAAAIPAEWVIPAEILPPAIQADVTTFPSRSGWFTKRELAIISTDAAEILRRLSTGAWTSEEVTRVFCKAAAAAHQLASSPIYFRGVLSRTDCRT